VIGDDGRATLARQRLPHEQRRALPGEGGPAILEVIVPDWIMAILYSDPFSAGVALGGEIRFEPPSGLNELRAEWSKLTKRVIPL